MTGGKVQQYRYFVRLFHASTLMTGGKVQQYPYFVRLFHTSTPLRSVELSEEWQTVHDWRESATLSLLCQTIPHFHTSEKCRTK